MPSARTADELRMAMAKVALGDEAAFALVYDATSHSVYGIVLRVLRDPAQAEEVAQEVFLEAWSSAPRYDPEQGTPSAWIHMIAHRRAVDRVRSAERSTHRDRRHASAEAAMGVPDVSELVVAKDEQGRVRRALATLPTTQRTALELAYFDGRTQREVAELLQVPLGTVKTRMRDAMKKLRRVLEEGAT